MGQLSNAEEMLRGKYRAYNEINAKSGGPRFFILKQSSSSRARTQQKPMKMIIKQLPKQEPEKKKEKKKEVSTLSAFEKAKRVLAAEKEAKAKAQEAKEKAKLAMKQKLAQVQAKSLKRPLTKRVPPPPSKLAKIEAQQAEAASQYDAQQVALNSDPKTIYAGHLPLDCGEEELSDLFVKFGPIMNIMMFGNKNSKERADELKYAFITFEDAKTAEHVVHMSKYGKRPPLLRNNPLLIGWAKEDNIVAPPTRPMVRKGVSFQGEEPLDSMSAPDSSPKPKEAKKVAPTSDDGRNMVTYDDDFL